MSEEIKLAEVLWNEIKDKNIFLFSLPYQKVNQYCEPIFIEPTKLYLKTKVSAFLPALETALGPAYVVEIADKYITVKRAE